LFDLCISSINVNSLDLKLRNEINYSYEGLDFELKKKDIARSEVVQEPADFILFHFDRVAFMENKNKSLNPLQANIFSSGARVFYVHNIEHLIQ